VSGAWYFEVDSMVTGRVRLPGVGIGAVGRERRRWEEKAEGDR
jgi:hypothetical protein